MERDGVQECRWGAWVGGGADAPQPGHCLQTQGGGHSGPCGVSVKNSGGGPRGLGMGGGGVMHLQTVGYAAQVG